LTESVISYRIHCKCALSKLGSSIETEDISASLNNAIQKDVDTLRLYLRNTAEHHRRLREAVGSLLVLAPDASEEVRKSARAFLEMEELVELSEALRDMLETISVGFI
jgi:hypothetical protein